jgi:hypothetical protein
MNCKRYDKGRFLFRLGNESKKGKKSVYEIMETKALEKAWFSEDILDVKRLVPIKSGNKTILKVKNME